jgi:prepilin-type processing-associated H-X9-DG protein
MVPGSIDWNSNGGWPNNVRANTAFTCPARFDSNYPLSVGNYGHGIQLSYGMNYLLPPRSMIDFALTVGGGTMPNWWNCDWSKVWPYMATGTTKTAKLKRSTEVVLAADGSGVDGMIGRDEQYTKTSPTDSNPDVVANHYMFDYKRHDGPNILYADGHVDWVPSKQAEYWYASDSRWLTPWQNGGW